MTLPVKQYWNFLIFFFIFLNRLNIIQSSRQKYGLIENFKAFPKMGLRPTDIQIQSRKKLFSIFRYFSLFLLTDLILSDQADQRMLDREFYGLSENGPIFHEYPNPEPKKIIFDFSIYFFFFLTDLILSDQAEKSMINREFYGLSENGPPSHQYPNPKKNFFDFSIFFGKSNVCAVRTLWTAAHNNGGAAIVYCL